MVASLCFAMPAELAGTPPGRAGRTAIAGFWWLRLVVQFVWLRLRHPLVRALSVTFAAGAMLLAVAAML